MEEKTAKGGRGYEQLEKCETQNGARSLHDAALSFHFPQLQTEVGNSEWQTILAKNIFTTDRVIGKSSKKENQWLQAMLKSFGCKVLRMDDLTKKYLEITECFFCS